MRLGPIPRRVFRQQTRQSNRFLTNLFAHELFAARRLVTLIEKQIKRVKHRIQSLKQFFSGGNLKRNSRITNLLFRSRQPLGNRSVSRQKSPADFTDAET